MEVVFTYAELCIASKSSNAYIRKIMISIVLLGKNFEARSFGSTSSKSVNDILATLITHWVAQQT